MSKLFYFIVFLTIGIVPCRLSAQDQFKVDSVLSHYKVSHEPLEKVKALIELSQLYDNTDIKKSYSYANRAFKEAEKDDDYLSKALAYNNLGTVYIHMVAYDKATEMLLKSKHIIEKNDDFLRLVGVTLNLGAIRYMVYDYDGALEYFTKSLDYNNILLSNGDSTYMDQIQTFYMNIGSVYIRKEDYKGAIDYLKRAITYSLENNNDEDLGSAYDLLGEAYLKTNNILIAKKYLINGLHIRLKANDLIGVVNSYNSIAQYYLSSNNSDSAVFYNNLALQEAERLDYYQGIEDGYKFRASLYEELGKYKIANDALKKYYEVKDIMVNDSTLERITRLQMEHEFNETQRIQSEQHKKKILVLTFSSVLLIFLLFIFVLLYNLNRSKAKQARIIKDDLEKDLELRNKELTTNVMYLLKKNELISSISTRLLRLKAKLNAEQKEAIQKIIFDLQSGADPEVWEEFELRFQNVHTDYYKKLQKLAPDLTPSELKICAFLKLNMNSKEISALIHQSTKSVEVKRSRIRKKLGLTNTDTNLVTYLTEI